MMGLFCFVLAVMASTFKSKLRLEAENAAHPAASRRQRGAAAPMVAAVHYYPAYLKIARPTPSPFRSDL
jgi:hypothetical protein